MMSTVGEERFNTSNYIKEYFNMKDPNGAAYINASGTIMAPNETKGSISNFQIYFENAFFPKNTFRVMSFFFYIHHLFFNPIFFAGFDIHQVHKDTSFLS